MPTISFNVPVAFTTPKGRRTGKCGADQRKGRVAYFQIGDRRIKFVLQMDDAGKVRCLTHHASGFIVGYLNDVKVRYMLAKGHHARLNDRQAAALLLAEKADAHGVDKVLQLFDAAAVINH